MTTKKAKKDCGAQSKGNKTDTTKSEREIQELEVDLYVWTSQLEDLQEELIDAVDSGKAKSILRIEKEILKLKGKIRAKMNELSGVDTSKSYEEIIAAAKELLQKELTTKKEVPVKVPKKKTGPKGGGGASSTQRRRIIIKRGGKITGVKAGGRKLPNIYADIINTEGPVSEKLHILRSMLADITGIVEHIVTENSADPIAAARAKKTWLHQLKKALNNDTGLSMSQTISSFRKKEIEG